MGAKQSKRSVDISATPKKGENGNAVNDAIAKIEEGDVEGAVKTVANGVSTHVEKIVEEVTEEVKEEVKTVTEVSNRRKLEICETSTNDPTRTA